MTIELEDPTKLLDHVEGCFRDGEAGTGIRDLFQGLQRVREKIPGPRWHEFVQEDVIEHPLISTIHLDPMCRHSFEKPRGYPGDAELLDYIYRLREVSADSPVGQAVHEYAVNRPAACAVRHRKDWIAYTMDRTVEQHGRGARVLSIACGHLREAKLSAAVQQGWLDELVALDADERSLEVAVQNSPETIRPVHRSIGRLLGRPEKLGKFSFVYSAGLYDYLEPRVARRLSNCMFEMLEPGGRMLFSNFLPQVQDAGFMETYMGWQLIYRDRGALADTIAELPDELVAERRIYEDPYGAIGYVEVTRERD